jgi:hypothetical protein
VAQTLRQLSDRINLTSRTQSQAWNFHSNAKQADLTHISEPN